MKLLLFLCALFMNSKSFGHTNHNQGVHPNATKTEETNQNFKKKYEEINADYNSMVKPIFERKCAVCHSADVRAPGYASIPIIRWVIEKDRSEAKKHLEISKGFPFQGHGTPMEDLGAIKEVITKNSMPTWLYSFVHSGSKLTDDEKNLILKWIKSSQAKLK